MKILSLHLQHFIDYGRVRGIPLEALHHAAGTLPEDFGKEGSTVDVNAFYSVLNLLERNLSDYQLGIKAGNFMSLKALGLIYQISLKVATIEEALFYLKTHLSSTLPLINISIDDSVNRTKIRLSIDNDLQHLNRILLENVLTVIARELSVMADPSLELTLTSPFFEAGYPEKWEKGTDFKIEFAGIFLKARLQDHSSWQLHILIPGYLKMMEQMQPEVSMAAKVKSMHASDGRPAAARSRYHCRYAEYDFPHLTAPPECGKHKLPGNCG